MKLSDYPDRIFPKANYKQTIDLDLLLESHDYQVSRRIDVPFEEATDDLGGELYLRPSIIESFDERLSMNILGAEFKVDDTKYSQRGISSKPWTYEMEIDKEQVLQNIEYKELSFPAVFDASCLTRTIPYNRAFNKKQEADDLINALGRIVDCIDKNMADCKLVSDIPSNSFLKHSPTVSNYWHVEFQIKPSPLEPPLVNVKSSWKKSLLQQYREECFANHPILQYDNDESFAKVEEEWFVL